MTQLTGKAPELDLELDSEIADGIYSNLAIISHSASEFVVDFATILPGLAKPKIRSRIVLTPEHAKRLMLSLQDNIARMRRRRPDRPDSHGRRGEYEAVGVL